MKITIIGATGKTGIVLVEQALQRGHEVTALVRSPEKLGALKEKVNVVQGDIRDEEAITRAVAGSEAVLSVFGQVKGSQPDLQASAFSKLIPVMEKAGVRRLIALTGAGIRTEGDVPKLADRLIVGIMNIVAKKILVDGYAFTDLIKKSNLDWTIVRAPILTEDPGNGQYATGMVGGSALTVKLSRENLATAFLDFLEKKAFVGEMPMVSNQK